LVSRRALQLLIVVSQANESDRRHLRRLPSLRKEALITIVIALVDDDGRTFQKNIDVKVNP
jgi:hypothetical protein